MTEAKHSPGEWELLAPNEHHGWYVEDGLGRTVCDLYYLNSKTGAVIHHDPGEYGETEANGRLIAAAPDHALVGWAMCVQDARWDEWAEGRGEFCFAGICHATTLDEFGCPVLTNHLRAVLTRARAESARAAAPKADARA